MWNLESHIDHNHTNAYLCTFRVDTGNCIIGEGGNPAQLPLTYFYRPDGFTRGQRLGEKETIFAGYT